VKERTVVFHRGFSYKNRSGFLKQSNSSIQPEDASEYTKHATPTGLRAYYVLYLQICNPYGGRKERVRSQPVPYPRTLQERGDDERLVDLGIEGFQIGVEGAKFF